MQALSRWQWTTLATLTIGYAGYYFCRSNFSVAAPLLLEAFADDGLTKEHIGQIATVGIAFYVIGKFFTGILCDFAGGRRMFLFGMAASIAATLLFGIGWGFSVFIAAWCINRLVQSMGWGALVKTAASWFPSEHMGAITGVLCLSYFFGDFLAKQFFGVVIGQGVGWRGVFFTAALVLGIILLVSKFTLKASPTDVGEPDPPAHPDNLFGEEGNERRPDNLRALLLPLLLSVSFWLVCIMNFGLTLIRETFNFWTPTYLTEAVGMTPGGAAFASSFFPFFGGVSVILAGYLSDRLTSGRRGGVMFVFLLIAAAALIVLARMGEPESFVLPVTLICIVGFFMLAPYAFLTGAISVDLGGKLGSSSVAGIADAIGYAGGMVSGWGVAALATRYGWSVAFGFLAGVLAVTAAISLVYWYMHEIRHRH